MRRSECRRRRPRNSASSCSAPGRGRGSRQASACRARRIRARSPSAREASSTAIEGTFAPLTVKLSGRRRTMSSLSVWTLSGRMFCCWRTAMRCPGDGLIGWLPPRTSPSTTLPFAAAPASARRKSRSKPRTFSPSMPSPNGISDCSIECRDHDVEAGHLGAAFERRCQHAADLAGPGQHRRALERGGAQAFLVDRDDDRRRSGRIVPAAEHLPAQRGEDIEGEPADRSGRRRNRSRRADQRDGGDHHPVARAAPDSQAGWPDTPIPSAAAGRRSASRRVWPAHLPGTRSATT